MSESASSPIRIATRASALALWQANHVADLLKQVASDREVEIIHVSTSGDRDQTEPLSQMGGLGVFTREVQKAVLDGRADIAVHSLKDLPTEQAGGLLLSGVPERANVFDVLVFPRTSAQDDVVNEPVVVSELAELSSFKRLAEGARVGSGSLRRRAQLLHSRGDLEMLEIRGNVETRLRKLDEGDYDVLCLASAGLTRLGLDNRIDVELRPPALFPAVGQGALGIECRDDDADLQSILEAITEQSCYHAVTAERSLLAALRAGCHAPVGVFVETKDDRLSMDAIVLSADGRERVIASGAANADEAAQLGQQVADELRNQGADSLLQAD